MYYENRWMIGDSAPTTTTTTTTTQSTWTRFEDKLFEQALVIFPEEIADRWQRIADRVPGKLAEEVRQHYEALVHDVFEIDSGRVELPCYSDDSFLPPSWEAESPPSQISFGSPKPKHADAERKKGVPWTPDEHRLFLIGLDKYGKGDWRSISRNVVVTRTPTQVASHAQKYFIRQNSMKKERKRSSIHDITTVDGNAVVQPIDQSWIASSSDGQGEQPPVLQALTLPSAFTNQGGSLGYQNFNFPM